MYKKIMLMTLLGTVLGTGAVSANTHSVEADGLRKRGEANTSSTVQGLHYSGEKINVVNTNGVWAEVQEEGNRYFVHSSYIRPIENTETTKTTNATSKSEKKVTAKQKQDGFIIPTKGYISQKYGPASGAYGYTFHNGIDIAAPTGTSTVASAAGQVIRAEGGGAYGNYVLLQHEISGKRYMTLYAHLNSINVSVGQSVKQGEKIGTVGSTGNSTGPHLHFELHEKSYRYSASKPATSVDPFAFFY